MVAKPLAWALSIEPKSAGGVGVYRRVGRIARIEWVKC